MNSQHSRRDVRGRDEAWYEPRGHKKVLSMNFSEHIFQQVDIATSDMGWISPADQNETGVCNRRRPAVRLARSCWLLSQGLISILGSPTLPWKEAGWVTFTLLSLTHRIFGRRGLEISGRVLGCVISRACNHCTFWAGKWIQLRSSKKWLENSQIHESRSYVRM